MTQTLGAKNVGPISSDLENKFRARVMVTDSCHLWTGSLLKSGHGKLTTRDGKRQYLAHRLSYALAYGEPGEMVIRHKCDNPWCVAPYHLELGLAKDNVRDAFERGQLCAKGTRNPTHWAGNGVFTESSVHEARRMDKAGMSVSAIARALGFNRRTVADVINGVSWSYVLDEEEGP